MIQHQKPLRINRLTSLLAGGCLLLSVTSAAADVGVELWQQKYNPVGSSWSRGYFYTAGFTSNGSILANGLRSEADSGSAVGVRYDAKTGAVVDSPAEWFLFEYTIYDYAHDRFLDQHIDSSGNVYFVGMGYPASYNTFSARYNVPNIWKFGSDYDNPVSGNPDRPLWKKYHLGSGLPEDNAGQFSGMAADSSDNIYAVGYFTDLVSATSERDWIIDKYDTAGTRAVGFPLTLDKDSLHDYASDVATDSEGNFVVVGSVTVDASVDHYDWVVRKYQSDGILLWETQYDHAGGHDQALYVAIDSADDVIVSGYRRNIDPVDENDWYIVKYAKDGDGNGGVSVLWDQYWDDGGSRHGSGYEMVLDEKGNFYIIGVQQKDGVNYSDRYRSVLQYRDGQTGNLLRIQDVVLDPTDNNRPDIEHDLLRGLAFQGNELVIVGYTQQDGTYSVTKGITGRVVMVDIGFMFKDGFE